MSYINLSTTCFFACLCRRGEVSLIFGNCGVFERVGLAACFCGVCGGAVASFCFFFFGLCLSHAMPSSLLVGEEQPEKIAFAPMATFLDKVMLLFLWLKVNRQRKDTWTFVLNCDHQ